jgi:hypothetical protein
MASSRHNIFRFLWIHILLLNVWFLFGSNCYAQCDDERSSEGLTWDFDSEKTGSFSIGTFLSNTFTPQLVTDTKYIRKYIIDERFQLLRQRCGDMRAVDAIYLKALQIADYNIARALFLAFMGVLEHRKVDVKMPILSSLEVPLTFEEDSVFTLRIKHLPSRIYNDSSPDVVGDRDKLQHFFGSAYLSYTSEASELTRSAGDLIEWGEAKIVVGGVNDARDKRANKHGESFGRDLLIVKTLLPSDYLTFRHEDRE